MTRLAQGRGSRRTRWNRCAVIVAMIAASTLAACANTSSSSINSSGTSTAAAAAAAAKPDVAFYQGKTITDIVEQLPGGEYYTDDQILDPLIAKYLHATVNIVSNATGQSIAGQDQIAAAKPDGLTIGTMTLPTDIYNYLANLPSVNFNFQQQALIGGITWPVYVFAAACTTGKPQFTSWSQLASDTASFQYLTTNGGGNEEYGQLLYGAFNLPAKILTGYGSTSLAVAGCQRGDGSMASSPIPNFTPAQFSSGQIKPLLVSGAGPATSSYYPYLKDVPTLADWAAQHPPTTADQKAALTYLEGVFADTAPNHTFFAPAGTPPARVAALQAAYKWAISQPQAQQALIHDGATTDWLTASQVLQSINTQVATADAARKFFKYGT
jgi:tripartite-type tricarboxylate transporter receptor subunit TctC